MDINLRRNHGKHRFGTVKTFYPEMMIFEIHRRRRSTMSLSRQYDIDHVVNGGVREHSEERVEFH